LTTQPRAARSQTRIPAIPVAIAAIVLVLEIATHLVDFGAWNLRVRLLDSAYEWSSSHILASVAIAAGAVICGLGALAADRRRRTWVVASALFGVLLIDNVTRLHDGIPHWQVLYVPLLAALCIATVRVALGTDALPLVLAGIALLCGSFAIHTLGPHVVHLLGWGVASWGYQVKVALKEGTELAGWVLLVSALLRCAVAAPDRARSARPHLAGRASVRQGLASTARGMRRGRTIP
jgi:hypothetical protein